MTLFVLAYLGGVLTIVSPCILPVLPFVFARSDRPFVNSSLPILAGMAATFAAVAAVGGGWAVEANQYGRIAALALLALLGITLLFPTLSDQMTRPVVALGSRLSQSAEQGAGAAGSTVVRSLLLGVATGLLWARPGMRKRSGSLSILAASAMATFCRSIFRSPMIRRSPPARGRMSGLSIVRQSFR